MASELRETIPTFNQAKAEGDGEVSLTNWSALTSQGFARNWGEVGLILLVAVVLIVGAEFAVRAFNIQSYIFPPPSEIASTLCHPLCDLFWPHMQITLIELLERLCHRRQHRARPGRGDHPVPVDGEDHHPLHPAPGDDADDRAGAAADPGLRLRHDAAHHRGGAGLGTDGDDQLRHRVPPHRSGQDRPGAVVWRDARFRSSPRCAFPSPCR